MSMRNAPTLLITRGRFTNKRISGKISSSLGGMDDEHSLRADCVKAFKGALKKGRILLSREDYKVAVLELLGYKPSKYEVDNVWLAVGEMCTDLEEGQYGLNLEQFTAIMLGRLKGRDKNEVIREIFLAMDVNQRGFLTEADCVAVFSQVVPRMRRESIEELFHEVDLNGDGRVSYNDFELMMKTSHLKLTQQK